MTITDVYVYVGRKELRVAEPLMGAGALCCRVIQVGDMSYARAVLLLASSTPPDPRLASSAFLTFTLCILSRFGYVWYNIELLFGV